MPMNGGRIVDGVSEALIKRRDVLVSNGMIVRTADIDVPVGAVVIVTIRNSSVRMSTLCSRPRVWSW